MWFFDYHQESNVEFNFEQLNKEADANEERFNDSYSKGQQSNHQTDDSKKQQSYHSTVCTHWIREVCNKGNLCKFLHSYDASRFEPCRFWRKDTNSCTNPECLFPHSGPHQHIELCKHFVAGFCHRGSNCNKRHPPDKYNSVCLNYLAGFCPEGPNCIFKHPKWPTA